MLWHLPTLQRVFTVHKLTLIKKPERYLHLGLGYAIQNRSLEVSVVRGVTAEEALTMAAFYFDGGQWQPHT